MAQIYESMASIMSEIEAIGKNGYNSSQKFNYRGIDQVYNALQPLLAKHKVFTTPQVLEKHRIERVNKNGTVLAFVTLRMQYTFWTTDGSSVFCTVEGEGMDSGDKASNKAMAVAHKYALLQTFCIPTEDMVDPDSESHTLAVELVSTQELSNIRKAIKETGSDEVEFCAWLQVDRLEDVHKTNYEACMGALNKKRAALNKRASSTQKIVDNANAVSGQD